MSEVEVKLVVCVPVTTEGLIDPRWGRADRVAITEVTGTGIGAWHEYEVRWKSLHDAGTEGSHHARLARFLQEHQVQAVVANHMGEPMVHMLERMGVKVWLGAVGDAREAALKAIVNLA